MNTERDLERRGSARLPKEYHVSVRKLDFPLSGQEEIALKSVDISTGGLRIQSPVKLESSQMLQVGITMPRLNKYHPSYFKVFESDVSQILHAVAEVAWVKEVFSARLYEIGIKFLDVDESDWRALRGLLGENL